MSLFQCENCGCCENTALSNNGFSFTEIYDWREIPSLEGSRLCSACGPTKFSSGSKAGKGKWHEEFKRIMLPLGKFKTNKQGNLEHIETGSTDYEKFEITKEGNPSIGINHMKTKNSYGKKSYDSKLALNLDYRKDIGQLLSQLDETKRLCTALLKRNRTLQEVIDKNAITEVDIKHLQSEVHAAQRLLYATADMKSGGQIEIPDANMRSAENGAVISCWYDEVKRATIISCAIAKDEKKAE